MVGDRREAGLVGAEGQQQVGDAVGRRQIGRVRADAEAVHHLAAGHDEQGALLADQPGAQLAGLEREAGLALELARVVAEQVAEQSLGDGLGVLVARSLAA